MGVPVTGKNYFPSNIQGLPTWYEIRVTRDGYAARASHVDIMVAMNAETYSKDIRELRSGGYLIYDSTWPRSALLQRGDITVIARSARQARERKFRRRAQPDSVEEHCLCRRAGRAARRGSRGDQRTVERELRQEAETARLEHQGVAPGVRLRQGESDIAAAAARRAHGQNPRPHHDRRQHGRRPGLRIRRRNGRRLVSHHALDLAHGRLQGLLRAVPRRFRNRRAQFRGFAGRG